GERSAPPDTGPTLVHSPPFTGEVVSTRTNRGVRLRCGDRNGHGPATPTRGNSAGQIDRSGHGLVHLDLGGLFHRTRRRGYADPLVHLRGTDPVGIDPDR